MLDLDEIKFAKNADDLRSLLERDDARNEGRQRLQDFLDRRDRLFGIGEMAFQR